MDLVKSLIFLLLICLSTLIHGEDIVVGVVNNEPPYTSALVNGKGYYGFCVDLAEEICSRLKVTCKYKETKFDRQLEDMRNGYFDMTFFPSPITSTKKEDYMYTLPYLLSLGQFITLSDNDINSIKDLENKKIGVLKSSGLKTSFLANYVSLDNVIEFPDTTHILNALSSHEIDAILINSSVTKYLINNVGNLKRVGKPVTLGEGYGISLLKSNAELAHKINKILLQMQEDGTYAKLYNKYFGFW